MAPAGSGQFLFATDDSERSLPYTGDRKSWDLDERTRDNGRVELDAGVPL